MQLGFDRPEFLWLLAILPVIWWTGYRRFGELGVVRACAAVLLRSVVIVAIVAALAGFRTAWNTDRVAVMYVLDQSDSIDPQHRQRMMDYVAENVRLHRNERREDLAGVVVFGKDAAIEVPPYSGDVPKLSGLGGGALRSDATNLEGAIELAQAAMPSGTRHRIVVVTDGNQTLGEVRQAASEAAAAGVGIDVVPVPVEAGGDVFVEQIDVPSEIPRGQPFETRVVLTWYAPAPDVPPLRGRLTVTRSVAGVEQLVADDQVVLKPGKNVFPLRQEISAAAAYTFEARFTAAQAAGDARSENNVATAFVRVAGSSRVLLVEPWTEPGSWDWFADRLRAEGIEVVVQASDATFDSLADLQAYDSVILANLPRTSGDATSTVRSISDAQVEMLVRNTQQLGAGLLMIGGPDAFGAGGWTGTLLEQAMPVDFDIKNAKVRAVGALMLVIDSSGSMSGEKIQLCMAAARAAVETLSATDYVGVLTFDGQTQEIVPLQPVGQRQHIMQLLSRIGVGGGTDMFPAMSRGYRVLDRSDASVKHMIVLTDGRTQPNQFAALTRQIADAGITVTSVAIGNDADVNLLRQIATLGRGKLYHVLSPRAIPQIVMHESRRVSRPLVYEDQRGLQPQTHSAHPVLRGTALPPPVTGYVLTRAKQDPLVQTLLTVPDPQGEQAPLLAAWQYGLGRAAVLTTDGGQRWTTQWAEWPDHRKLYAQLVRWLTRPSKASDRFSLATTVRDGRVHVVVHALDDQHGYLDFLRMTSAVLDPDLQPIALSLRQTGPGRYTGSFPADRAGSYFVNVVPQPGVAPLVAGVNVPYGSEYRARQANLPLLRQIAAVTPRDGRPGTVADPLGDDPQAARSIDPFRGGLAALLAFQDAWHWAVLVGCCLFLGDVMVRRIDLQLRLADRWRRFRGEHSDGEADGAMLRLDALQKAKRQSHERRATGTFAAGAERASAAGLEHGDAAGPPAGEATGARRSAPPPAAAPRLDHDLQQPPALSYTERLLRAKQQASSTKAASPAPDRTDRDGA